MGCRSGGHGLIFLLSLAVAAGVAQLRALLGGRHTHSRSGVAQEFRAGGRRTALEISQYARKLIETVFGDAKQHDILRQVKLPGLAKVELLFTLAATVVNLRRLPKLLAIQPSG